MKEIYQKYRQLGLVTLLPILIILAYILYLFSLFYKQLKYVNFDNGFTFEDSRHIELLIMFVIFIIIFSGIFSAIASCFIYLVNGSKENEKWMKRAHNLRIYSWILLTIFSMGLVGVLSAAILDKI